jgi:Glycosyltransferase like family 2
MTRRRFDAEAVRALIGDATVAFAIPAYNEGDGVLPTLRSLWQGLADLRLTDSQLILCDSYDQESLSSADLSTAWAHEVGARLEVDSIAQRRSLKEALNSILDRARTDVLVSVNADVLVPAESLAAMLFYLFSPPRPIAAIGTIRPDPEFSRLSHRAGAWQMRAVWRASSLASRSIDSNSFRSEGAFWGVWRAFYSTFRFPIGSGSIHDDIELTRALVSGGHACRNAAEAFVYKIPPGSLLDLCSGSIRFKAALPGHKRGQNEYTAALIEAARDPLGALLYGANRIWCRRNGDRLLRESASEKWRVLKSTKRRSH